MIRKSMILDRTGNVVGIASQELHYFLYGEELLGPAPENEQRYGTYYRNDLTSPGYARQRYYHSGSGRFLTPDPYRASAGPADPGAWNRYAYVQGDPVNFNDPSGLYMAFVDPFGDPGGGGWWSGIYSMPVWGPEGYMGSLMLFPTGNPPVPTLGGGGGGGGGRPRIRSAECDSLLPTSPTGDFSGLLTDGVVKRVADVSNGNATLAALVTVTWWAESRFSMRPINNGIAFGPMQLVPGAWDSILTDYSLDDVYGAPGSRAAGERFSGDPVVNIAAGAHVLSGLLARYGAGHAAGFYRAGEGEWVNSAAGQEAFKARQGLFDRWSSGKQGNLIRFFEECIR